MQTLDRSLADYVKVSTSVFRSWDYLPFPRLSPLFRNIEDGLRESSGYISSIVTAALEELKKQKSVNHTANHQQSLLEKVHYLVLREILNLDIYRLVHQDLNQIYFALKIAALDQE